MTRFFFVECVDIVINFVYGLDSIYEKKMMKITKFFYVAVLFFFCCNGGHAMIAIDDYKISEVQPINSNPIKKVNWNGRIVVLWSGLGEYAWAKRLENACANLGWKCFISIDPAELSEYDKLVQQQPSTPEDIVTLVNRCDPDCVISLKWDRIYTTQVPNYLSATGVFERILDPSLGNSQDLLSFDGILHVTSIESLKEYFLAHKKQLHSLEWYPSASATPYIPVNPRSIFYCGFQWDEKRNGPEYRKLFSLLDQQGHLDIYGPKHKWDCAINSVRGMTFDEFQFKEAMRKSGIVLILHTDENIAQRAPAARIFESAAAGCVIISDKHPFILNEFGDSILYIDDQDGESMFNQIETHYNWILSHPVEAESMARKAHAIFSEKFTLEKQLIKLRDFHLFIQNLKGNT